MRTCMLLVFLLCTVRLAGQDNSKAPFPEAPQTVDAQQREVSPLNVSSSKNFSLPVFGVEPRGGLKWRTVDSEFLLLNAVSTCAAAADVQTTIRGLRVNPHIVEGNPIFGSRPTLGRILAIEVPMHVFTIYESYRAKRDAPRRGVWKTGPRISIVAHSAATLNNFYLARLNAQ